MLLFLNAHLHETESLQAISDRLLDEDLQEAVGFESISAAQLSRKNNEVHPSILSTVFRERVQKIHSYTKQKQGAMPLKIIDSGSIPLNLTQYKWVSFRETKAGVKLH